LCETCGNFIREFQGVQSFNPKKLLGDHPLYDDDVTGDVTICTDPKSCMACFPPEPTIDLDRDLQPQEVKHFMMWVGRSYYTKDSFTEEANIQGISKRISANGIPDGMIPEKSLVYLAMRNIMDSNIVEIDGQRRKAHGIFMVFRIQKLEYLIWESEATPDYIKHLEDLGLTPVIIPDGDEDHAPKKKKRAPNPFAMDKMIEDLLPVDYPHEELDKFFVDDEEELT
jgi:hypothetical protein